MNALPLLLAGAGAWLLLRSKGATTAPPLPARAPMGAGFSQVRLIGLLEDESELWPQLSEAQQAERIADYWAEGLNISPAPDHPWSAAFISWAMQTANPGAFPAAASHSVYAWQASQGRGKYRLLPPEVPVQVGDVVLKWRGEPFGLLDLDGTVMPAHGDIVTEITSEGARAIGGNKTGGAVMAETYPLNSDGSVAHDRVFGLMRREGV